MAVTPCRFTSLAYTWLTPVRPLENNVPIHKNLRLAPIIGKVIQEVKMTNEHFIVQSYILDPVVVVLLDNKTIQVFQYEQNQLKTFDVLQPDVSS